MSATPSPDLAARLDAWASHVERRSARRDAAGRIDDSTRRGRARILALRVVASLREDGLATTVDLIVRRIGRPRG